MAGDERGNDYFKHLDQGAGRPPAKRPRTPLPASNKLPEQSDFGSVPDPFGDPSGEQPAPPRPAARPSAPGLSPGVPRMKDTAPRPETPPRSGVVLTPSGVRRLDGKPLTEEVNAPLPEPTDDPADIVDASAEPQQEQDEYAASREKNNDDDLGWEEYAAEAFPAVEAEELGVKTKTTDSGRIVPVAIRADLAPKDKSAKGKAAKTVKAAQKNDDEKPATPQRSWMGRLGQSLRMKIFGGKIVVEDEEQENEVEEEDEQEDSTPAVNPRTGFPTSGSMASSTPKAVKKSRKAKEATGGRGVWSILKTFTVEVIKIVLLVMLLRAYVLQVSEVKGPSMEPTLIQNDRLVVERVTALIEQSGTIDPETRKPAGLKYLLPDFLRPRFNRGDLIVVRSPEDPGSELVKRLIALPGDTIKFNSGKLWIKPLGDNQFKEYPEPYLDAERVAGTFNLPPALLNGRELTVPEDRIFVMGDNRGQSNDSRRWLEIEVNKTDPQGIGRLWLHMRSIEGRVLFRIYPFDRVWPPVK